MAPRPDCARSPHMAQNRIGRWTLRVIVVVAAVRAGVAGLDHRAHRLVPVPRAARVPGAGARPTQTRPEPARPIAGQFVSRVNVVHDPIQAVRLPAANGRGEPAPRREAQKVLQGPVAPPPDAGAHCIPRAPGSFARHPGGFMSAFACRSGRPPRPRASCRSVPSAGAESCYACSSNEVAGDGRAAREERPSDRAPVTAGFDRTHDLDCSAEGA